MIFKLNLCCFLLALVITFAQMANLSQAAQSKSGTPVKNRQPENAKRVKDDIAKAAEEHKKDLERLLVLLEQDVRNAAEMVERRRALLAEKMISQKDLEKSERDLASAKAQVEETRKRLAEAELLLKAYSQQANIKKPYSKETILKVLRLNALPDEIVIDAIKRRGVNFHITPEVEAELRLDGATPKLLKVLASNHREK